MYCTCETRVTLASILFHQVNTSRVVLTLVTQAVINIHLTSVTLKPSWTMATVEAKCGTVRSRFTVCTIKTILLQFFYHGNT